MRSLKSVAFIPARSGSKRIPDKNVKYLNGHPLIAYAIQSAIKSGKFDSVVCVTDSSRYAEIASYYGAEVPCLRPQDISGDTSPDIFWVDWVLQYLNSNNQSFDVFSILRPTSPFRRPETISRAWDLFLNSKCDSIRAIEKCLQHPGKMWVKNGGIILPIMPFSIAGTPWHSNQYASLPEVFIQNASLEISWVKNVTQNKSISGDIIAPFFTEGLEGFDINNVEDWILAENYVKEQVGILPEIHIKPYIIKK